MFPGLRRNDRQSGTFGRGLSPQEKLALGTNARGQAGDRLIPVTCELRALNDKGTSIAIWLGEWDGERADPETGEMRPWEKWVWLPLKCTTETATGVVIPEWLARKKGLMAPESSSESGRGS
jgi:hypothetical protein